MDYRSLMPTSIDHLFPYICFAYGVVMTFALNMPVLDRLAEKQFAPDMIAQWRSHRGLAAICLGVGGLWILQNLWLA